MRFEIELMSSKSFVFLVTRSILRKIVLIMLQKEKPFENEGFGIFFNNSSCVEG